MRLPRMTMRRWMSTVAGVAVLLAVQDELIRIRQKRVQAEVRQLDRALGGFRRKYGEWPGCRGTVPYLVFSRAGTFARGRQ
jgi:hypothetical protein